MTSDPVRLSNSNVRAVILPLGAALHRLQFRLPDDSWRDIVLSRPDPSLNDTFQFGATIGRYANRIAGARVTIDGVEYPLAANEGPNQVHGGPVGFSDRVWRILDQATDHVTMSLISPDGDQGFPGKLTLVAQFSLFDDGIGVIYSATADAATVLNITAHPYFNLTGVEGATVDGHELVVAASQYTPTDTAGLPTGEITTVAGTPLDLREGRVIRDVLAGLTAQNLARAGGLNHAYVVDGEGLREHARLIGPDGLTVIVRSDAPGVEVYSAEALGRRGLAIEPQDFPDAPNQPGFPSTVLRPGEVYRRSIEWLID